MKDSRTLLLIDGDPVHADLRYPKISSYIRRATKPRAGAAFFQIRIRLAKTCEQRISDGAREISFLVESM
jgi:hypothetical protein